MFSVCLLDTLAVCLRCVFISFLFYVHDLWGAQPCDDEHRFFENSLKLLVARVEGDALASARLSAIAAAAVILYSSCLGIRMLQLGSGLWNQIGRWAVTQAYTRCLHLALGT